MSVKSDWIDDFVDKLLDYDYETFHDNIYAFQLAVAYFDWADVDTPEQTVDEAFERYLKEHHNDSRTKA